MGTGILKVNDNAQISAVDSKLFRVIFMKLKKKNLNTMVKTLENQKGNVNLEITPQTSINDG